MLSRNATIPSSLKTQESPRGHFPAEQAGGRALVGNREAGWDRNLGRACTQLPETFRKRRGGRFARRHPCDAPRTRLNGRTCYSSRLRSERTARKHAASQPAKYTTMALRRAGSASSSSELCSAELDAACVPTMIAATAGISKPARERKKTTTKKKKRHVSTRVTRSQMRRWFRTAKDDAG